jgi:serine/threonine protein kinase
VEHLPKGSDVVTDVARVGPGDMVADKYLLGRMLGMGGMGVVFLAEHLQLGGQVALKFLSAEFLTNPEAIGRFRREAQAAAKLKSEHVVRVFDVGIHHNGLPYMVMEYLEGGDLGALLRDSGPLPSALALDLLIQTCSAVAEAHRQGIVHRDLKPSNLFCVPRADGTFTIKVVDFGISKLTGALASLEQGITVTGNVVGSPSYMSPEQMKSPNRIDHRTDIWSLGVVLYECLTGNLPFPASTYAEICLKVHQDPPLPVSAHGVELAPELEAVIHRCLAKEPDERYATAFELAAALAEFAPPPVRSSTQPAASAVLEANKTGSGPLGVRRASGRPARLTSTQPGWAHSSPHFAVRRRLSWFLSVSALLSLGAGAWFVFREKSAETAGSEHPAHASSSEIASSMGSTLSTRTPVTAEPSGPPLVTPEASAAEVAAPPSGPSAAPPILPRAKDGRLKSSSTRAGSGGPAPSAAGAMPQAKPSTPAAAATVSRKPTTERDSKSSIWTR